MPAGENNFAIAGGDSFRFVKPSVAHEEQATASDRERPLVSFSGLFATMRETRPENPGTPAMHQPVGPRGQERQFAEAVVPDTPSEPETNPATLVTPPVETSRAEPARFVVGENPPTEDRLATTGPDEGALTAASEVMGPVIERQWIAVAGHRARAAAQTAIPGSAIASGTTPVISGQEDRAHGLAHAAGMWAVNPEASHGLQDRGTWVASDKPMPDAAAMGAVLGRDGSPGSWHRTRAGAIAGFRSEAMFADAEKVPGAQVGAGNSDLPVSAKAERFSDTALPPFATTGAPSGKQHHGPWAGAFGLGGKQSLESAAPSPEEITLTQDLPVQRAETMAGRHETPPTKSNVAANAATAATALVAAMPLLAEEAADGETGDAEPEFGPGLHGAQVGKSQDIFMPAQAMGTSQSIHIARAVAGQLAVAVESRTDGSVELTLRPEELGKIRLELTRTDQGMAVVVFAERPETAHLIRRHMETLSQAFSAQGYEDVTFEFANQQRDGAPDKGHAGQSMSGTVERTNRDDLLADPSEIAARPARRAVADGALDLRM